MIMDRINGKWLLPTAVDELLPPQAEQFALFQQKLLAIFYGYGYELLNPPIIEFLHSLVIDGTDKPASEIAQFIDKSNGESLGVRADFTPQAARVEASKLRHDRPNRICYCGDVFRNYSESTQLRNQVQAGVELFGEKSLAGDKEVVFLLIDCLTQLSKKPLILDLGHAQLWRCLSRLADFSLQEKEEYFTILKAKKGDAVAEFLRKRRIETRVKDFLLQLPYLYGDEQVMREAKKMARPIRDKELSKVMNSLQSMVTALKRERSCKLFLDLGEMPSNSYSYHNGLVFGVYFEDRLDCFAKGGRYDSIAGNYGQARAATGFSIDIRSLFHYTAAKPKKTQTIFAPFRPLDGDLQVIIKDLRKQGRRVVSALNKKQDAKMLECPLQLVKERREWVVSSLGNS